MNDFDRDSMLETFIYEMNQMLEQLENETVQAEDDLGPEAINEIFRIMHTIKGSAAMMLYDNISSTAHVIEDLFFYLRESKPQIVDYGKVTDLTLEVGDFVKKELEKLESGSTVDGESGELIQKIKIYVDELKSANGDGDKKIASEEKKIGEKPAEASAGSEPSKSGKTKFRAKVFFQADSEMENIRAYTIVHNLEPVVTELIYEPSDLFDELCITQIRKEGFKLKFESTKSIEEIRNEFMKSLFIRDLELKEEHILDTADGFESVVYNEFEALIHFEDGSEMENVRAYGLVYNLSGNVVSIEHVPEDLINESAMETIRKDGLKLKIVTDKSYEELFAILNGTIYLKSLELKHTDTIKTTVQKENKTEELNEMKEDAFSLENKEQKASSQKQDNNNGNKKAQSQHAISVSVQKLDLLLNLVGELVTSEAMVTQNSDLKGLVLDSFTKEASQLRKIIKDVQDTVMSMRMVPLSQTFFKMHRIVRDMCKQLGKEVNLEIIGENTEVDKNIIEHISDPLMHIIRNSVDHGIEIPSERAKKGKDPKGTVTLEAKNSGGDVLISIKDDGAGFNRDKILAKAKKQGLLTKPEYDYTDREIYNFILLPGFSTNDSVTSYSGRGVGMDVVSTNIEMVGGTVVADSLPNKGSSFTLKIPLTLAIIEGMIIRLGDSKYTIPIVSIVRSFKAKKENILIDPNGNEMIMVRGECYNLVRLKEEFQLDYGYDDVEEGIVMMLENGSDIVCVLVDELLGEQQVVVKSIPKYIKKIRGISGCTLLGNGDISLIIDVAGFFDN